MKVKDVLKKQIERSLPELAILKKIEEVSKKYVEELGKKLSAKKISGEVFVGGSVAKKTITKKKKYDVDVFVRFSEEYREKDLSKLLGKVMNRKAKKIHGSRDYYQEIIEEIVLEIIPVLKISKPEEMENVTDLSYFHVNYILGKLKKNKELAQEIVLAKSFCEAQRCYGAESYVRGFSGYGLELLILHYGSFEKFLIAVSKMKSQMIIDDAEFYKKKRVLTELNESKIQSPIILIDPTFKERNALAGLSEETFSEFKKIAKEFLKNPSEKFFVKKEIEEILKSYSSNLQSVEIKTSKQKGDIGGTKMKKFFGVLCEEIKKEFLLKKADFFYDEEKNVGKGYFDLDEKIDEEVAGPSIELTKHVDKFKKVHKNAFVKGDRVYAEISHNLSFEDWLKLFRKENKKLLKDMSIIDLKLN